MKKNQFKKLEETVIKLYERDRAIQNAKEDLASFGVIVDDEIISVDLDRHTMELYLDVVPKYKIKNSTIEKNHGMIGVDASIIKGYIFIEAASFFDLERKRQALEEDKKTLESVSRRDMGQIFVEINTLDLKLNEIKEENKKRIKEIEEEINEKIDEYQRQIAAFAVVAAEYVAQNFADLQIFEGVEFLKRLQNFVKSASAERVKSLTFERITNIITKKKLSLHLEILKLYRDLVGDPDFSLENLRKTPAQRLAELHRNLGEKAQEVVVFFRKRKEYKELLNRIDLFERDFYKIAHGLIEDVYLTLAQENYELSQQYAEYDENFDVSEAISVTDRQLIAGTWKKLAPLMKRYDLTPEDFEKDRK